VTTQPDRAVILSCSQRKTKQVAALPAIHRYDGPYYQVLRRYLRYHSARPLLIWIISAEYGFIDSNDPIELYDRRITSERASELALAVEERFRRVWSQEVFNVFINLSADYQRAFDLCLRHIGPTVKVEQAKGGIGTRSGQLRRWLYSGLTPAGIC
jgi:cytoplasmic iron level regulating protein YaaA (DUF328/UPF0246 family)